MDKRPPNDLTTPVPKFCLALEEFRRTADGRVRTSQEFLQHFFPYDATKSTDRIFKFTPNEVRAPVLTAWGLRGAKSALKDTDEKVQSVVWDALLAGDIDHEAFEAALGHDLIIAWAPLADWWTFWRAGKLSKLAIHKALDSAYGLGLFDAKWFFETIEGPSGKLKGTDVVSEGLTKAELTEWVRKIHASGDGSPKGMLTAIGWDRVIGKTPNDVLIRVIDALAQKVALVPPAALSASAPATSPPGDDKFPDVDERPSTRMTPVPAVGPATSDPVERALMNAAVQSQRPGAIPTRNSTAPQPQTSDDERVDALFSDSQVPPAEDPEGIFVVEDEIDVSAHDSSIGKPTSRPPPADPEQNVMKVRPPPPGSVTKIPMRR